MAIELTDNYMDELNKQGDNIPSVIIEVALDSGSIKWGSHSPFEDVIPVIEKVSSV